MAASSSPTPRREATLLSLLAMLHAKRSRLHWLAWQFLPEDRARVVVDASATGVPAMVSRTSSDHGR